MFLIGKSIKWYFTVHISVYIIVCCSVYKVGVTDIAQPLGLWYRWVILELGS